MCRSGCGERAAGRDAGLCTDDRPASRPPRLRPPRPRPPRTPAAPQPPRRPRAAAAARARSPKGRSSRSSTSRPLPATRPKASPRPPSSMSCKKKKNAELTAKSNALKSDAGQAAAGGSVHERPGARRSSKRTSRRRSAICSSRSRTRRPSPRDMTNQLQADFQEKLNPMHRAAARREGPADDLQHPRLRRRRGRSPASTFRAKSSSVSTRPSEGSGHAPAPAAAPPAYDPKK